jgi:hypothetical protein
MHLWLSSTYRYTTSARKEEEQTTPSYGEGQHLYHLHIQGEKTNMYKHLPLIRM